jgi:hypothetical protein
LSGDQSDDSDNRKQYEWREYFYSQHKQSPEPTWYGFSIISCVANPNNRRDIFRTS